MYVAPSNKRIIDTFYEEVLPAITKGNLRIGNMSSGIHFNVKIYDDEKAKNAGETHSPDLPAMIIRDKKTFNTYLVNLIQEMYDFRIPLKWKETPSYVKSDKECLKHYLSTIWSNMTYNDFENPEEYMQRYLSFLNDTTFKYKKILTGPIDKLNGYNLEITNVEQNFNSETPYALRIKILDETGTQKFILPDIKYGIEETQYGKIAYIYAIQYDWKTKKENEGNLDFAKKINRLLYKVNEEIGEEELSKSMQTQTENSTIENIVDITPSFVMGAAVSMFLFKQNGISNVVIPNNFPVRWESIRMVDEEELEGDIAKYNYSEQQINDIKMKYQLEQHEKNIDIVNKMLRNFRRLAFHFNGLDILNYSPDYKTNNFMNVKINEDLAPNNPDHLLAQVSQSVADYYQKGNKIK